MDRRLTIWAVCVYNSFVRVVIDMECINFSDKRKFFFSKGTVKYPNIILRLLILINIYIEEVSK